jgi:hypothetical protein
VKRRHENDHKKEGQMSYRWVGEHQEKEREEKATGLSLRLEPDGGWNRRETGAALAHALCELLSKHWSEQKAVQFISRIATAIRADIDYGRSDPGLP